MMPSIPASVLGALCLLALSTKTPASLVADFEDIPLPPNSFYNGSDFAGDFASGGVTFGNAFDNTFGDFWSGFAVSNINAPATPGFGNQYAVASGTGLGGSGNYGVVFEDTFGAEKDIITLSSPSTVAELFLNNTAYTALSMRDGDGFAKQFGGPAGSDPDFFLVTLTGKDAGGQPTGSLDFYLADYRFADPGLDYIVTDWTRVDATRLGPNVSSIHFALSSSDNGPFGMNTPAYFAIDGVTVIPEPASLALLLLGIACASLRRRTVR